MSATMSTAPAKERRPNFRCLVLNADYRPLATYPLSLIPAQEAVSAVWRDRVAVVETWEGAFYRSPSTTVPVPKVVALRHYAPINANPKFCRRSILLRDRYRCQYCGDQFEPAELTFDHVTPRAAGGKTEWTNILTCCVACNKAKGSRLPNYSGRRAAGEMRPLKPPRQPTTAELLRAGLEFIDKEVIENYGSWLYFSVELSP